MKTKLLFIVMFFSLKTFANPSVTIVPYPGIQEAYTTSNIIYFKVSFTEDVVGFTESDIVVSGTANANNAYVQSNRLVNEPVDYRNYLVGVTGMALEGTVSITIPVNVAYSINDGTGNQPSNTPIVNYSYPLQSFSTYVGNTINYSYFSPFMNYSTFPTFSCGNNYADSFYSLTSTTNRGLRFVNNSDFGVCVKVSIYRLGNTPAKFNIYKDSLPTDSLEDMNNYVGGVDGQDFTPSQRNGYTYTYGSAFIYPWQTFYVMAADQTDTNFYISISNLPTTSLNYLSTEENLSKNLVKIYPNPVKDILNIDAKNLDFTKVYDASGKLLKTSKKSTINVSGLPKGTYFIEISDEGKITRQKFIKN